jgi:hypothetical protein
MPKPSRRYRSASQRQTCHEPSSRNLHCPTCVSHEAGFIQARTFVARVNLCVFEKIAAFGSSYIECISLQELPKAAIF